MRKINKTLALLLVIAMLLSTPVYAAEKDQIMPCSSNILSHYNCSLYVPSENEIQIDFSVIGTRILDQIGVLKIEIQQSTDGESWTTIETFESEDHSNMIVDNRFNHHASITYYGEYGYYYRAKVTFWGKNDGAVYAPTIYTDMIYLAPNP